MAPLPPPDPRRLRITDYTYHLPEAQVAQFPEPVRDAARLLVSRAGAAPADHVFTDLPAELPSGALLVFNDTRVVQARLRFQKESGTTIEVFCLEPHGAALEPALQQTGSAVWQCLIGNRKRWRDGVPLTLVLDPNAGQTADAAEILASNEEEPAILTATPAGETPDGEPLVRFAWTPATLPFADVLARAGLLPLPPYLHRAADETDAERYQTVYARAQGAVAAPTAGLHFTPAVLDALDARGFERAHVTLHVGAGTFRPVKADEMAGHAMHSEEIVVSAEAIAQVRGALAAGQPVVAVGTTSARTLESLYWLGARLAAGGAYEPVVPQWAPYAPDAPDVPAVAAFDALLTHLAEQHAAALTAHTHLLIAPGYLFRVVSALLTNFHQPESTLLLLVAALVGETRWRAIYDHALRQGYRFLSYGDSSLLIP